MTRLVVHHPTIRAAALVLLLSACGAEQIVQPSVAASCREASLTPGASLTAELSERSCVVPFHFWSGGASPTATYVVSLERGKGYWFYMQQAPDATGRNTVDALLSLWGRDAQGAPIPLAVSDDDAGGVGGLDAEFYFIAPRSGVFDLLASSYSPRGFGGYRLTMAECPVVAMLDTIGTYAGIPLPPSDCVRHGIAHTQVASRIVLVAVQAGDYESVFLDLASDDFTPSIEVGGPGFDVFASIFLNTRFDVAVGDPASAQVVTRDLGGTLTLAVGADVLDATGSFSIDLGREDQENLLGATSAGSMLRAVPLRPGKR